MAMLFGWSNKKRMFCVWYEIIDLHVTQVGQLSGNTGLFILTCVGEKKFVSIAIVSDRLVALCKHYITATIQVLLPAQQAV